MGRLSTLALLIAIGLGINGCGFVNGLLNRNAGTETTPEATEDGTLPNDTEVAEGTTPDAEGAATPETTSPEGVLPALPNRGVVPSPLLASTDPTERLKAIQRDRPDPYQYVPVLLPPPAAPPTPAGVPQRPATEEQQALPPDENVDLPDLPTIPEPSVASSQIQVTGIVRVNGKDYAIVQAPGEPTSRYVTVGDRLSNGSIFVKRIETRPGSDPVLVVEERGLEIPLPVGSGAPPANDSTAQQVIQGQPEIAVLPALPLN